MVLKKANDDSWKNPKFPKEQRSKFVDPQLKMLHRGNPPPEYTVAAEALNAIPGSNKLTLLDFGCASGYYSEVIPTLVGKRFKYTGSDYSLPMLTDAKKEYPNTTFLNLNICDIQLSDKAYDVVLSGAVLVHVEAKEWKEAAKELARITKSYLILHRTPVTDAKFCSREKKILGGHPVPCNTFNKNELMSLLSECGFSKIFEKNVYPHEKKGLGDMTYVLERLSISGDL